MLYNLWFWYLGVWIAMRIGSFITLIDNCEFKLIDTWERLIDALEKLGILIANWIINFEKPSDCEVI